jgi:archaellum biogenesis ATPase FlaH
MYDDDYMRRVLPFILEEYFTLNDRVERTIFIRIKEFIEKYNTLPTKEAIIIDLTDTPGIDQDDLDKYVNYLNSLEAEKDDKPDINWLIERTEEWCQTQAFYIAATEVVLILDGKDKKRNRGMIPKMFQDALAVSFDPHVGHDFLEDAEERFEFYHKADSRIPFHLDYFNKITKNGVPNKTLNICLAGTNVGKSLFMCDMSANYLKMGKNVLYITLEMAEERIAERIDANLMNRPVDDLTFMSKELYLKQIEKINDKTKGKLIIKEYPTASAHVGHFRHLLNELQMKKQFKPDAIFIDYLNICSSFRVKASTDMYQLVKSIAEELRGLAVEFCVPVWSATQTNRAGFNNSDPDLTNTSESFGLPMTADFMFSIISNEELANMNQFMVKILKNRYGDIHMRNKETGKIMSKFIIGVDRSKQKLFNVEESAQKGQDDNGPLTTPKASPLSDDDDAVDVSSLLEDDAPMPSSGPSGMMEAEITEPVFDIDIPSADRPFNSADEEADRRRSSAKNETVSYRPKQISQSAYSAGQKPRAKLQT